MPSLHKELFILHHDELIDKYLEEHPFATDEEAINATSEKAWDEAIDSLADMADHQHDLQREG